MAGEAYFKLSDWSRAEFWYREALSIKPDHIPAHLTLAKLLHRQVSIDCQCSLFIPVINTPLNYVVSVSFGVRNCYSESLQCFDAVGQPVKM